LVGGGSGSAAAPQTAHAVYTVTIENMQFSPSEIIVHAGDRIVFKNKDLFPHTATADGKVFDSHAIAAEGSWSYVVSKLGEYPYSCTFHATMKGKVTVR
jgi:plastocyanin